MNSKNYRQVRVFEAVGKDNESLILLSSVMFGPSWPTIAFWLQELDIDFRLIQAGKTLLVVGGNQLTVESIENFAGELKNVRANHVYIQDHGFVETRRRKRLEPRSIVLPALSLLGTVGLASFGLPTQTPTPAEVASSCILDSKTGELISWVEQLLAENSGWFGSDSISLESDQGVLFLESTQSIGTTNYVLAQVVCDQTEPRRITFRTDSSGGGVFALVMELDS